MQTLFREREKQHCSNPTPFPVSTMSYVVRSMGLEDLPQVTSIERDSFLSPCSSDYFRHELTSNQVSRYLIACQARRVGGRITPQGQSQGVLGYIGMWLVVGEVHITTIAVRQSHRRKGIGELLLISAIELALEHRASFVTLEVRESNSAARTLYGKYGFAKVGIRDRYYRETNENAVIMSTENISTPSFQNNFQWRKREHAERCGLR